MPGAATLLERTGDSMDSARRVALWITQEEADAVMSVLLHAPPSDEVPGEMAERLLCRVADLQRQFSREAAIRAAEGAKQVEVLDSATPRRRLCIRRTGCTRRTVRL
jgi:hypothetical protein